MKMRCIFLMLNNSRLLVCFFCILFSIQVNALTDKEQGLEWKALSLEEYKQPWMDDIQFHGFLSQGLFHSSGYNVHGKSKDNIATGLTEIGLNMSYQATDTLSFSAQGLYRRAGAQTGDAGALSLDFAFFDYALLGHSKGQIGIRGGRIKNPWGLYNSTRDVSFTRPTILLPLVYFERSRALLLSMDGGQFYTDYHTDWGDIFFKMNVGVTASGDTELLYAITNNTDAQGRLESSPSFVTQVKYEMQGGKYVLAMSYADLVSVYQPFNLLDTYTGLNMQINSLLLSAQYNGEKFSLEAEYNTQWNDFSGIPHILPVRRVISEHWYIQAGYRILDNVQMIFRYDSAVLNMNDRNGLNFAAATGMPKHGVYTRDIVMGLRWDITAHWMLRGEYHRMQGYSMVTAMDNLDLSLRPAKDWDIYALQISYRF